ncbi:MAG: beta-aspartate methyltransferase [Deltaproteobacteria bacterium]|jgi:glycine reductase|nr:beta-aspartate methyltransferase [Deltaproteobacteria bacterium]
MLRIIHYVNQFFGQIGGEDKAGAEPVVREGAVGPGMLIDQLLAGQGKQGRVVATLICGDNYFTEKTERAAEELIRLIDGTPFDVFIAGPAFNAGRYGIACGEMCKQVKEKFGVPVITGMFHENPGADLYKRHVHIIATTGNAAGMSQAMPKMIQLVLKMFRGEPVGRPEDEGYIPQGVRANILSDRLASERAIELLLRKMRGEEVPTEIPFPSLDVVPAAPPVLSLAGVTIAIVTEGALVPIGNPDGIESARATRFATYSVAELEKLGPEKFQSIHRGFDTTLINEDPNRLVPADALRELEREGVFGKLHDDFYVTAGVATTMENARKIGQGIASRLKKAGVAAAILTST